MKMFFILICLFLFTEGFAQKVNDILEDGIVLKNKQGVFLRLETDKIKYETGKKSTSNFDPLKKDKFFLLKGTGANIYLTPLNPLNYSIATEIKFEPDAINSAASETLKLIISSISGLSGKFEGELKGVTESVATDSIASLQSANDYQAALSETKIASESLNKLAIPKDSENYDISGNKKLNKKEQDYIAAVKTLKIKTLVSEIKLGEFKKAQKKFEDSKTSMEVIKKSNFLDLPKNFEEIAKLLSVNKKSEITAIFKSLKELDFLDEDATKKAFAVAQKNRDLIEVYYKDIKTKLDAIPSIIDKYKNSKKDNDQAYINAYVLTQILKDEQSVFQTLVSRLSNLDKILSYVNKTITNSNGKGKEWYVLLKRASLEDEKVASTNVTIYKDGYELSADNEIIKSDKKELVSSTLKFRKFQLFVPEVSAGIVLTKLSFPKYATETDPATGKLRVADAGKEDFKQMAFSGMINFNYYLPNSDWHPFWQIGIGANTDYPTFLTGIGFRLNVGLKRLAISTGYAGTWIKTLQTLQIGKNVDSDAALQKDLKYEFSFPLQPYIGIQLNF